MAAVVDVIADVVEHRGRAEQKAVALSEGVHAVEVVEELGREARHVLRVRLVEVVVAAKALARVEHALGLAGGVPHVEELVDELLEDARGEAHARGENCRLFELLRETEEDRGRREDGVGAVRAELPRVAPLAVRHAAHLLEECLGARDVDGAPFGRAEIEQRVDVSPRADEDVDLAELRQYLTEGAVDGLLEQALAAAVDGLHAFQVGLEHAHGAERERHRDDRFALLDERHLGGAAAHVDEDRALTADGDAPRDRELDEARFFDPLDGLELDVRLAARALDQRGAVLRLADCARGDGAVGIDLRAVHLGAELAQRVARLAD